MGFIASIFHAVQPYLSVGDVVVGLLCIGGIGWVAVTTRNRVGGLVRQHSDNCGVKFRGMVYRELQSIRTSMQVQDEKTDAMKDTLDVIKEVLIKKGLNNNSRGGK